MEILSRIRSFLTSLLHRQKMESEMGDELRFHLEARADDLVAEQGVSREEALRRARIEFGSIDKYSEVIRESRGLHCSDTLWRNTRYALRQFIRNPGFTLAAVLTLALGIGANTGFFSLYYQTHLSPLPVEEPERLVNLATSGPQPGYPFTDFTSGKEEVFSYPMFRDLERTQTVFTGVAAQRLFGADLAAGDETWSDIGYLVSGSYFEVLGVNAAIGRLFNPEDDTTIDEPHLAVLSYAFWQRSFGGDPDILNRTIIINGQQMTVIGVTERGFEGNVRYVRPSVFASITMRKLLEPPFAGFEDRQAYWLILFARLKPGVSMEQARMSLNHPYHEIINEVEAPLLSGIDKQTVERFRAKTITVQEGNRGRNPGIAPRNDQMIAVMGLAMFLWIIACTNVAGLLLARGAARRGEITIRRSIGADRAQVAIQLLTESCLLTLLAGIVSIAVAQWTIQLLILALPPDAVAILQFSLNTPMLIFAAALTIVTGLLCGLLHALYSIRPALSGSLKVQSAGQPGIQSSARFRKFLITGEITLALALLIVAGLFTRYLFNVNRIDIGLKTDNITVFSINPTRNGYSHERALQLYERLEDELEALPGVTRVTSGMIPLFDINGVGANMSAEGFDAGPDTDDFTQMNFIGPGYFRTLGIPLISGREFTRSDASTGPQVAVINEAFAEKFELRPNPVGKYIGYRGGPLAVRIVGLVKNSKFFNAAEQALPFVYRPYRQEFAIGGFYGLTFYIHPSMKADVLTKEIRMLAAKIDPNLPVTGLLALTQKVHEKKWGERALSRITMGYACLAILLTAVGLYGVLAYTVQERTREIGLRVALGATPAKVHALVLRQAGFMALIGCIAGLALAAGLGRVIQSVFKLNQFDASNPAVFSISTLAIVLIALAAGCIPAYRASRIDPIQALRCE